MYHYAVNFIGRGQGGKFKADFMAKSIGIHFFEFEDMFRCLRDNENLKIHFGHMYTLKLLRFAWEKRQYKKKKQKKT